MEVKTFKNLGSIKPLEAAIFNIQSTFCEFLRFNNDNNKFRCKLYIFFFRIFYFQQKKSIYSRRLLSCFCIID